MEITLDGCCPVAEFPVEIRLRVLSNWVVSIDQASIALVGLPLPGTGIFPLSDWGSVSTRGSAGYDAGCLHCVTLVPCARPWCSSRDKTKLNPKQVYAERSRTQTTGDRSRRLAVNSCWLLTVLKCLIMPAAVTSEKSSSLTVNALPFEGMTSFPGFECSETPPPRPAKVPRL